jgi:NADPH-dependent 2,4-dienoyl-CoA reductase/sulfur reductase-like enzyme/rhodanese-related sulfurtransferase/TusA-related sulfurtransferase
MKNYVVIGGNAGGATAAAQLRRLQPAAHIVVIEQGPVASAANCGLVYALGNVIKNQADLVSDTPEFLARRLNLDFRMWHEVVRIDRDAHHVTARNLASGEELTFPYDKLFLVSRSMPRMPDIPGVTRDGVFPLRSLPHLEAALTWIHAHNPQRAVVIGGGFLGLEVTENLMHRGLSVALLEQGNQVMPMLDQERSVLAHRHALASGVDLRLNVQPQRIESSGSPPLRVVLQDGQVLETDLIMVTSGARPDVKLAHAANLRMGALGGLQVDTHMRTSDPDIYAIGDAVETPHRVTGAPMLTSLPVPMMQQARIAAMHATGREASYAGTLNTFICPFLGLRLAGTGASEKNLRATGTPYEKVLIPATQHAPFYPGARELHIKLLFSPDTGKLLGAQSVGFEGVDKRIDVLATALTAGMTVRDLEMLELAYSPPFSSHRDPINVAGGVAHSVVKGKIKGIHPDQVADAIRQHGATLVDTRTEDEYLMGALPGALHIPADEIMTRYAEIPSRTAIVYCQIGSKSTSVQTLLRQRGFICFNLFGGYKAWQLHYPEAMATKPVSAAAHRPQAVAVPASANGGNPVLDATGLICPGPIVAVSQRIKSLTKGQSLDVWVSDPTFVQDLPCWAKARGHHVGRIDRSDPDVIKIMLTV